MLITPKYKLEKNNVKLLTVDGECTIGHKRKMKEVCIESPVLIGKNARIEAQNILAYCVIGRGCNIERVGTIGRYVTIGEYCRIGCRNQERNVKISNSCILRKGSNALWCSGVFEWDEELKIIDEKRGNVNIGNDVWIGDYVIIYEGVKIGDGAIIHSGSVVVNDVAPYTIVQGNPAIELRKRYDEDLIEELLRVKWWEKTFECLNALDKNCQDIRTMLQIIKKTEEKQSFKKIRINSLLNEIWYEDNGLSELIYKV